MMNERVQGCIADTLTIVRNGIQFEEIFGYKTIKLNFVFLSSGITMPFCELPACL